MVNVKPPEQNTQEQENCEKASPCARLIQLGREKSFITPEDILREFPEPEKDVEALDRIFAALTAANIPYIDEDDDEEDLDI
jgi:RNA polymerase primary sigma factor